jgi:predicted Zn-dependent peptidase
MTVQHSYLSNGLQLITDHIPHVETVSFGVWVRAGSRNEPEHLNGAAHFLEHMAFKGTKKRNAQEIAESIEQVGGYFNAYTSREITAYYGRVLKKDLALGLDILADILQNSTFDITEMDKEREVILQEIGQTNDCPNDIVFDYFEEQCFPNQALGRSILGPEKVIKNMTRDDLMRFMQSQYTPDKMVISVAGNLDHEAIVSQCEKVFSHIKKPLQEPKISQALYKGGSFHKNKSLDQLHLLLGFEGCPLNSKKYFPLSVLTTLLGGGMSSRLFQEVREKKGLAYSVYSFSSSYSDTGVFGIYAGTSPKESSVLIKTIFQTLEECLDSLSSHEIDRAKNQLKASLLMALESTTARSKRLASNLLLLGRLHTQKELIEKINAVSHDEIQETLKALLRSPLTFTSIGPQQELQSYDEACSLKNQLIKAA